MAVVVSTAAARVVVKFLRVGIHAHAAAGRPFAAHRMTKSSAL
jgi:hypothetical protein